MEDQDGLSQPMTRSKHMMGINSTGTTVELLRIRLQTIQIVVG